MCCLLGGMIVQWSPPAVPYRSEGSETLGLLDLAVRPALDAELAAELLEGCETDLELGGSNLY